MGGGAGPVVSVSVVVIVVAFGATHFGALTVVSYANIDPFVVAPVKKVVALAFV